MELFESELLDQDQNQTTLPVEPEPRYQPAAATPPTQTNQHGHTWIRTIGLILLGLVLVVAIVLLARWGYHRVHHSNSTNGSSNASSAAKLSASADKLAAGSSSLQNSSPSAPAGSSSSSSTSSSSGSASSSSSASSTKISNTGPGNVVGLFVGTSLAAAGLHFVISLRRFNKARV